MKKLIFSIAITLLPAALQAQYVSEVWCPDNGDGTFSVKFEDKTYKTYDSSLLLGANVAKAKAVSGRIVSNCKIGKPEADKKSYSVKDLLKQN